jgi:hypothetical protein
MSIPCHQTMTKDLRMAVNGQKEETFPVSYLAMSQVANER